MELKVILAFCCVFLPFISCGVPDLNALLQLADGDNNILQIFEVTAMHGIDNDDVENNEQDAAEGFEYMPDIPVAHIVSTKEIFVSRRPSRPIKTKDAFVKNDKTSYLDPYWKYKNVVMPAKPFRSELVPSTNASNENINETNQPEINNTAQNITFPYNGFMKRLMKNVGQKVIDNQEILNKSQPEETPENQRPNKIVTSPITILHVGNNSEENKAPEVDATQYTAEISGTEDHSQLIKKFHSIARQALPFAYVP